MVVSLVMSAFARRRPLRTDRREEISVSDKKEGRREFLCSYWYITQKTSVLSQLFSSFFAAIRRSVYCTCADFAFCADFTR